MKAHFLILASCLVVVAACQGHKEPVPADVQTTTEASALSESSESKEMTIQASDGQKVFAHLYNAPEETKSIVLMFHQARSNAAEYAPIAPRVAKLGYDCLAIDQRSGGEMWDTTNRTAAQYSSQQDFMAAYPDLEGALTWAKEQGYEKIIAWGSSYTACLVLKLASENPEIDGVLSFSPGDYFEPSGTVKSWNAAVKVPVFMTGTKSEVTHAILDIYNAAPKLPAREKDVLYMNKDAVHGSKTLREDSCPDGYEDIWSGVEIFFDAALAGN